jgi:predicted nucleotidyltransferase
MSSVVKKLVKHGLMNPSNDFVSETVYEVIMGSMAYGVSSDTSDMDVYAVCVPDKTMVFPHLGGQITGFGPNPKPFQVFQKHHMELDEKEYDVVVYSLVFYFQLCYENNPNMLDSLFVPDRCVIAANDVGQHMRSHRKLFLSKRVFDKLRGYAFGELKKLEKYNPKKGGKRGSDFEKYGYDAKSAYHVVRLMLEAEMVLHENDLDLERNREQLKFVRRGGYTLVELHDWFQHKEKELTTIHASSSLPLTADYERLRVLLLECLEMHFGSLEVARHADAKAVEMLERVRRIVNGEG